MEGKVGPGLVTVKLVGDRKLEGEKASIENLSMG